LGDRQDDRKKELVNTKEKNSLSKNLTPTPLQSKKPWCLRKTTHPYPVIKFAAREERIMQMIENRETLTKNRTPPYYTKDENP